MSIVNLKKLTLAGLLKERMPVLEQLQTIGCLHLVSLAEVAREPETVPPAHAVDARKALRYLCDVPDKRHQVRADQDFDMPGTVAAVLANQDRLRQANDGRDTLAQHIEALVPWGDFRLPDRDALAGRKLWFYIVPERQMPMLEDLSLPWKVVHKDNRQSWVVVIDQNEPPGNALPVPRAHTGALSLGELYKRLDEAEVELEDAVAERQALTRWIYLMSRHLARAEDQAALSHAAAQTLVAEALFLVQGWVPEPAIGAVSALAEQQGLAMLLEEPQPADRPPTLLENPEPLAAGQDLVGFYQMPAYGTWDPSRVVFFSFATFFAMILSDAGYALVLGLLLAAFWLRMGRSETGLRWRTLCSVLVGGSLVWGVLVGSYFGVSLSSESFWGGLKLLDLNDFDTMTKLSVGIGVLHLVLAHLEQLSLKRGRVAAWAHIGWIAVMLGGFAMWLGGVQEAPLWLSQTGRWALGLGLLAVFAFASERVVRDLRSAFLRLLDGIWALTGVTKVFGDVLSYLRLFALGLASASLALTFNDLAQQASQVRGMGLLFAILILLVGHLLNLLLALMSGVVHGLRLNYIEFYNWALSGEGYAFQPFKKKESRE
jgi:V/A-type H+-transporting ATPase subunit I